MEFFLKNNRSIDGGGIHACAFRTGYSVFINVFSMFVMQHAKTMLFWLNLDSQLFYYSTKGVFSFHLIILLMFLGHINPKLGISKCCCT